MIGVDGDNVASDRRHVRRSLIEAELTRLIRAAESGPKFMDMDGPTRALCYRVGGFHRTSSGGNPVADSLVIPRTATALRSSVRQATRGTGKPPNNPYRKPWRAT